MTKTTTTLDKPKAVASVQTNGGLGPVSVHEVYPLDVFKRLTGLAGWAIRRARRDGLRVVKVGRRRFVRGSDFAEYVDRVASAAATDS